MFASELTSLLKARLLGDDVNLLNVRRLDRAGHGDLSLLLRPQDQCTAPHSQASCLLLSVSEAADVADKLSCTMIVVDYPFRELEFVLSCLASETGVRLGKRVSLAPGVILGADAFVGYSISSRAGVYIGDDVEIGANTCVDAGILECTTIGAGAKIDNQVQIGHDSCIGKNAVIAGQSGIAGHVTIGDDVVIGGKVGILPHVIIGAGARVNAGALVCDDIDEGEVVSGSPAIPHMDYLRACALRKRR